MSFQKNILIGAGVLGVVLVMSKLVSGETPKNNDDVVIGGDDPSYLSKVNPYGINPETGNTFCEDYNNCPDDGLGEPEKTKVETEPEKTKSKAIVKDDKGRLEINKTIKKSGKAWYRTTRLGWLGKNTKEGAALEKSVKKKANLIKDNKEVAIGAGIGFLSPIPGGTLIGAALGTEKGRKATKKQLAKKLKFWEAEETHSNINSSQSFMSEFF